MNLLEYTPTQIFVFAFGLGWTVALIVALALAAFFELFKKDRKP